MALSAAQEIGGVIVRIGGDIGDLRIKEREAKAVATSIGNTRAIVKVGLDVSAVRAGLAQITSMARSLPPIKIPVQLVPMGGGGGAGMLGGGGGYRGGYASASWGAGMLPGPGGSSGGGAPIYAAGGGGGGWTGSLYGNQGRSSGFEGPGFMARGAGPAPGGGTSLWNRPIGVGGALGIAAAAHTIQQFGMSAQQAGINRVALESGQGAGLSGLQMGLSSNSSQTGAWGGSPGYSSSGASSAGFQQFISSLPIVHSVAEGIAGWATAGPLADAAANDARAQRMQVRFQQRKTEIAAGIEAKTGIRQSYASSAARLASPEAALDITATEQREQLAQQHRDSTLDPTIKAGQRAALEASIRADRTLLDRQRGLAADSDKTRAVSAGIISGGTLSGVGSTEAAFSAQQAAARNDLVGANQRELKAEQSPFARVGIEARQSAEVGAFDAQAAQQKVERAKDVQSRIVAIAAEGNVALLNAQQQGDRAQLAAFDEAARQRLDAVRNASAQEIKTVKDANADMRKALVVEQGRQTANAVAGMQSSADVAELRSRGRSREANLAAFDAATRAGYAAAPANTVLPFLAGRVRERNALIADQGRLDRIDDIGLGGRVQSSRFRAAGMSGAAGIASTIASAQQELAGTDPARVKQVAAAQLEEFKAMKADMLRPKSFASEFDPNREIVGGPSGETGRDQLAVQKLMEQHLKKLADTAATGILQN